MKLTRERQACMTTDRKSDELGKSVGFRVVGPDPSTDERKKRRTAQGPLFGVMAHIEAR